MKLLKHVKLAWKVDLPINCIQRYDVNCLIYDDGMLYAGCSDNAIHVYKLEQKVVVQSLKKHSDFIQSMSNLLVFYLLLIKIYYTI